MRKTCVNDTAVVTLYVGVWFLANQNHYKPLFNPLSVVLFVIGYGLAKICSNIRNRPLIALKIFTLETSLKAKSILQTNKMQKRLNENEI